MSGGVGWRKCRGGGGLSAAHCARTAQCTVSVIEWLSLAFLIRIGLMSVCGGDGYGKGVNMGFALGDWVSTAWLINCLGRSGLK